MKLSRNHAIAGVIIAIAALIALAIILAPNEKVTGSVDSLNELSVVPADGESLGQSLQGEQLVPAPNNQQLQSSGSNESLQPTGSIN